jgi:hypothetical protein
MGVTFTKKSAKRIKNVVNYVEQQTPFQQHNLTGNFEKGPPNEAFAVWVYHNGTDYKVGINGGYRKVIGDGSAPEAVSGDEFSATASTAYVFCTYTISTDTWTDPDYSSTFPTDSSDVIVITFAVVEYANSTYKVRQLRNNCEIQLLGDSGESETGLYVGIIAAWHGNVSSIPLQWSLCDGTNGTPDLRHRFIVGADYNNSAGYTHTYEFDETGGYNYIQENGNTIKEHSLQHVHHARDGVEWTHIDLVPWEGGSGEQVQFVTSISDGECDSESKTWGVSIWCEPDDAIPPYTKPYNDSNGVALDEWMVTHEGENGAGGILIDNRPPYHVLYWIMYTG